MKKNLHIILIIYSLLFLCDCTGADGGREQLKSQMYAELRLSDTNEFQILIRGDVWGGGFTAEGFRGYTHNIYYWSTLSGLGPVYKSPVLEPTYQAYLPQYGTITVDRERKIVIIDMQVTYLNRSGPQATRMEPSDANGVYPIKMITHNPFRNVNNMAYPDGKP